jgi:hypothetical protein
VKRTREAWPAAADHLGELGLSQDAGQIERRIAERTAAFQARR